MNPSDFYTRKTANEGKKMFLMEPDGSISAEHFLLVRSVDSDNYREAKDRGFRLVLDAAQNGEDRDAVIKKNTMDMYVSLIAGWSFDTPCTPEAIAEFLTESPNNTLRLDKFASDRKTFFTKELQPSQSLSTQS